MKKTTCLAALILVAALILSACGSKAPSLSGRYSASGFLSDTVYEFSKEGTVTFKVIAAGYVAVTLDGTYSLNESGSEITLTFDEANTDFGSLLDSSNAISGTFTFSKGENYIQIGNTQYSAVNN